MDRKNTIVTQVMVFGSGFHRISDEQAIEYLQREVGKIKRYRRKRCWMPTGSHVSFKIRRSDVRAPETEILSRLKHAYVHFESAEAAYKAPREADAGRLRIGNCTLKTSMHFRNETDLGRREFPLIFDDVVAAVEIGNLDKQRNFNLVWRESNNPSINFVIDPYRRTFYIRFIRDAAVSSYFMKSNRKIIIKCEVKIECSMDRVSQIKVTSATSSSPWLVFELHLTETAAFTLSNRGR